MDNKLMRQTELDYAKTLAIFFMVIIHVLEELSCFGIEETLPSGFGRISSSSEQAPLPRRCSSLPWALGAFIPATRTPTGCSGGAM